MEGIDDKSKFSMENSPARVIHLNSIKVRLGRKYFKKEKKKHTQIYLVLSHGRGQVRHPICFIMNKIPE